MCTTYYGEEQLRAMQTLIARDPPVIARYIARDHSLPSNVEKSELKK